MDGVVELPAWIKNPERRQRTVFRLRWIFDDGETEPQGGRGETEIEMPFGGQAEAVSQGWRRRLINAERVVRILQKLHEGAQVVFFHFRTQDTRRGCPNRSRGDETRREQNQQGQYGKRHGETVSSQVDPAGNNEVIRTQSIHQDLPFPVETKIHVF